MTRNQVLTAIRSAGATNDKQAFMRLYCENRISLAVAQQAFREGARLADFVASRDAHHAATGA